VGLSNTVKRTVNYQRNGLKYIYMSDYRVKRDYYTIEPLLHYYTSLNENLSTVTLTTPLIERTKRGVIEIL
jgi:hypothetical protein